MNMKQTKLVLIVIILLTSVFGTAYAQEDETYQIGTLLWATPNALIEKMTELGYVEGENITYLSPYPIEDLTYGSEEYQAEYAKRVKAIADGGVDVFVVETDSDAVYLQEIIGDKIPIVFARADDPVASGVAADLITPGGNVTGTVTNRPHERRLQLLVEIKPTTKKVYYIMSTYAFASAETLQQVQVVADELGVELVTATLTTDPGSSMEVVNNIPEDADWVFITPFVFLDEEANAALMALSVERHFGIATIISDPTQGYLISYGPSIYETSAQAALQVDRILRGAYPGDLSIQTAENYLSINLEAAAANGIEVPESVLRQANIIARPGYFESLITPTPES
jgi:putative ABC transport system substrate-binding protein